MARTTWRGSATVTASSLIGETDGLRKFAVQWYKEVWYSDETGIASSFYIQWKISATILVTSVTFVMT